MDIEQELDKYLDTQESPHKERDYFYISEVGKSKKEIFESIRNKTSKKFEPRVKRILDNGNYMHMRYYKWFAEMGILRAVEISAVENDLFHGRADCLVSDKEGKLWLIDLKSMSQWPFQKLKEANYEHKMQLLMYMYYMKIDNGMILVECKDNQTIKIFKFEMNETNKKICEKVIEEFKILKENIKYNVIPSDEPIIIKELAYEL